MTVAEPVVSKRSYSQLNEYAACSMRYKLHRIDGVDELPATWLYSGSAFHEAIEAWELSRRTMTIREVQDLYSDRYDDLVGEAMASDWPLHSWLYGGRGTGPEKDIAKRAIDGRVWVEGYIKRAALYPEERPWTLPDGTPAVEVPFTLSIELDPPADGFGGEYIEVRGYIDALLTYGPFDAPDNKPERIRDYKTGAKDPASIRQLQLYRLGVAELTGHLVNHGDYYMAKKETVTMPVDLSAYGYPEFEREFVALELGIREEVFIANPGDHCRPCGVKHACPAFNMKG